MSSETRAKGSGEEVSRRLGLHLVRCVSDHFEDAAWRSAESDMIIKSYFTFFKNISDDDLIGRLNKCALSHAITVSFPAVNAGTATMIAAAFYVAYSHVRAYAYKEIPDKLPHETKSVIMSLKAKLARSPTPQLDRSPSEKAPPKKKPKVDLNPVEILRLYGVADGAGPSSHSFVEDIVSSQEVGVSQEVPPPVAQAAASPQLAASPQPSHDLVLVPSLLDKTLKVVCARTGEAVVLKMFPGEDGFAAVVYNGTVLVTEVPNVLLEVPPKPNAKAKSKAKSKALSTKAKVKMEAPSKANAKAKAKAKAGCAEEEVDEEEWEERLVSKKDKAKANAKAKAKAKEAATVDEEGEEEEEETAEEEEEEEEVLEECDEEGEGEEEEETGEYEEEEEKKNEEEEKEG